MSMIQIRNVPEHLHEEYRRRASEARMSLSDYLLAEMERGAQRPSRAQMLERLNSLPKIDLKEDPVDIIRAYRDRDE